MSGAHVAIKAKENARRRSEEEHLPGYNREDLTGGWEFKIVRSLTQAFEKPEFFYQVLEEEALAGWELLEKLDESRLRFKRPTSARKRDMMLPEEYNPYRTRIGISEGTIAVSIITGMLLLVFLLVIVINLFENGGIVF